MATLNASLNGTPLGVLQQQVRWRKRFTRTGSAIVKVPANLLSVDEGEDRLQVYLNGGLVHSGPCWYTQAEGSPDAAYGEITSYDDRVYLGKRLAKSATGNLITPASVILSNVEAPAIASAFLANSLSVDGALPLAVGTVATGGPDVTGVPMDFPMKLSKMFEMLISTGQLETEIVPGVNDSVLNFLNNESGTDLSATVSFGYRTGSFNAQVATVTVDMEDVLNAILYYLGPRVTEERWRGSITGTAPHVGGTWPAGLVSRWTSSRALYYYMQDTFIFDDNGDENDIRALFEEIYANDAWVRAVPRTFASVRPMRGIAPTFDVGDLIGVAWSGLLGSGSGAQRVYEFEVQSDADGVVAIEEILTSADQEGATGST